MQSLVRSLFLLAAICGVVLAPTAAKSEQEQGYPIVVKHAFGTTMIEKKPVRIASVAWANHEVALALGVVPVGMAAANFGDDDGDGVLPWVTERLKQLGAETPVLFDEGDGIDFEAVAATSPDLILAAYSGLSESDYQTLSQIAPVVAYPDAAWSTDWRQMIRLNSTAMGLASQGDALINKIESEITETLAAFPQLKAKSALFVTHLDAGDLSTIHFYTTNDTRVKFFQDLGLVSPKSVIAASEPGQFSGSISSERVDLFDDVDIIVTYGGQSLSAALKSNPLLSKLPVVKNDALVMLGRDPLGTAANPTPLSIPFVLKDYVALLAGAADKSK
ncbi:iron-siderophore ABC transporter substrate-binding protein [Brucella pseudogrignonensis]|jgi:iron complex transport system substrate-binding protein|uniref:Iron-siderophore ABC transporter substrate-binding protein n=1 Tax=Brucella pseudogrignonensis TaxID=419475 RepID=A0A7Y3TBH1_9HYPH|nr:iron-siderophore ABC transporter substrate-binding protein [Brucella pseudogrignonensis]EMG51982.1 periplasmic binding protein [Ochrobactrum sp. CDB2]MBK0022773.1 iron-siderophore ABC transporter substrate-binding protein [Ochrobactrum sp. S45]MBK0044788.1 iron-siderophore ABC transporter substrate-binding protein [Ochrobactrum sp. S46]MBO1027114.1 iron-siderophore ABC transporter substrate-binding protein [Ochrobactrum sp. SD129]MQP42491.1 ABC transporter substrate-binding protein [Ochroba